MKHLKSYFSIALSVALSFSSAFAKSKPVAGFTVFHIGEPKIGEPFTNKIPHGESAISALLQTDNGLVFAGTSIFKGTTPWIVCYDPVKKSVPDGYYWPLASKIIGEKSVTSLVSAVDGYIYGATSNMGNLDYRDYKEVAAEKYAGGHLLRFKADASNLAIEDLGIAFAGEGIAALVADLKQEIVYGITSPGLIFFSMNISDQKVERIGKLGGVEILRNRYIGKAPSALVVDDSGNVYGSAREGRIFKYDPKIRQLSTIAGKIPTEGEGESYDAVTSFVKTKSGRIFGGTFIDGKLFELFPQTGKIKQLGITGRTGELRGLAEKDGLLYGLSGSKKVGTKLFVFNTANGEYKTFPGFKVYFKNTSIKVVPFQLDDIILLKDGTFIIGENSSNGHLFLYEPEKMEWNNHILLK